jgi:hypothetical protein
MDAAKIGRWVQQSIARLNALRTRGLIDNRTYDDGLDGVDHMVREKTGKTMSEMMEVWDQLKQKKAERNASLGPRDKRPQGYSKLLGHEGKSITEAVRIGMIAHPNNAVQGAKVANVGTAAFSRIRKLLSVLDKNELAPEQAAEINEQLSIINATRHISIKAERLYGTYKNYQTNAPKRKITTAKQRVRLDKVLLTIGEICDVAKDTEIPSNLSQAEAVKAVATLSTSIELIAGLINRLTAQGE